MRLAFLPKDPDAVPSSRASDLHFPIPKSSASRRRQAQGPAGGSSPFVGMTSNASQADTFANDRNFVSDSMYPSAMLGSYALNPHSSTSAAPYAQPTSAPSAPIPHLQDFHRTSQSLGKWSGGVEFQAQPPSTLTIDTTVPSPSLHAVYVPHGVATPLAARGHPRPSLDADGGYLQGAGSRTGSEAGALGEPRRVVTGVALEEHYGNAQSQALAASWAAWSLLGEVSSPSPTPSLTSATFSPVSESSSPAEASEWRTRELPTGALSFEGADYTRLSASSSGGSAFDLDGERARYSASTGVPGPVAPDYLSSTQSSTPPAPIPRRGHATKRKLDEDTVSSDVGGTPKRKGAKRAKTHSAAQQPTKPPKKKPGLQWNGTIKFHQLQTPEIIVAAATMEQPSTALRELGKNAQMAADTGGCFTVTALQIQPTVGPSAQTSEASLPSPRARANTAPSAALTFDSLPTPQQVYPLTQQQLMMPPTNHSRQSPSAFSSVRPVEHQIPVPAPAVAHYVPSAPSVSLSSRASPSRSIVPGQGRDGFDYGY